MSAQTKACWPAAWIEAAERVGLAAYEGSGTWLFIDDKMRDMLGEFAALVAKDAVAEERERAARACELTWSRPHGDCCAQRTWDAHTACAREIRRGEAV